MILVAEHLSISFGGLRAVDDVSLSVAPGLVFSIIGPNGAGKTTLFNIISGLYLPEQGRVRFAGEEVTALAPEKLARRGLLRTFQNLQIFFRMSVLENVMVGRYRHELTGIVADLFHLPRWVGKIARRERRLPRRSSASGLLPRPSGLPAPFLSAISSASKLPARLRASPSFCSSTSRQQAAIRWRLPGSRPSFAA
jgi:branched-chain amino acid transport system ATP-binding protein